MAEQSKNSTSDEVDLGQLFQLIGKGFNRIFNGFLRFFLFIKKNLLILLGLGVLGVAIGFGIGKISSEKVKTEVIVRPNLESQEYLYDVVYEIQANVKSQNQEFFDNMDIEINQFRGLKIEVIALGDKKNDLESELKYLDLLRGLDVSGSVSDIVRNEILSHSSLNHKVTFTYRKEVPGQEFARKIMEYINTNPYFNDLIAFHIDNAKNRIQENRALIGQLDVLIERYTANLASTNENQNDGRIILDTEEQMDIRKLFDLKNSLIRDIEAKKVELKTRENAIKIINFGKPQEVDTPFFSKSLVIIPIIFVGLFFLWSIIVFLNKKALEIDRS